MSLAIIVPNLAALSWHDGQSTEGLRGGWLHAVLSPWAGYHSRLDSDRMPEYRTPQPSQQPLFSIDSLRLLLDDLPLGTQMSLEDQSMILLFDADDQPVGVIQVDGSQLIRIDLRKDE